MDRNIKVTARYREEFNVGLYALALIELARQLQEQEDQAVRDASEKTANASHAAGGEA